MTGNPRETNRNPRTHRVTFGLDLPLAPITSVQINFRFARIGERVPGRPKIDVTQNFPDNPHYQTLKDMMLPVIEYAISSGFDRKAMLDDMESNDAVNNFDGVVTKIFGEAGQKRAFIMYQSALEEISRLPKLTERPDIQIGSVTKFLEETIEQAINSRAAKPVQPKPSNSAIVFKRR